MAQLPLEPSPATHGDFRNNQNANNTELYARSTPHESLPQLTIDIGGAIGSIFRGSESVAKGGGLTTSVARTLQYFTGATFVTNNGTIYFDTTDTGANVSVWSIGLFIFRKYSA